MEIDVKKFKNALAESQLDIEDLAHRMWKKHKRGSRNTIYYWTSSGKAGEELFTLAIDCLNEYESEHGWKVKRLSPFRVEDFIK